jgi:hypothetical protein
LTLLQETIKNLKSDDDAEKIKLLCDQISKEEKEFIDHPERLPYGPNIFLSLEVPGRMSQEVAYLTLEREGVDFYLAVLYTLPLSQIKNVDVGVKKQRVWQIEDHRPEKVLTGYAKVIKYLRGE